MNMDRAQTLTLRSNIRLVEGKQDCKKQSTLTCDLCKGSLNVSSGSGYFLLTILSSSACGPVDLLFNG